MSEPNQESGHRWFAALYDRFMAPGERRLGRSIRSRLVDGLTGRVLEIGAGTGANFEYYPQAVQIVATEPDQHMMARAQKRLAELSTSNIELRQTPAAPLPFEDGEFDHVISALVLCTVPDQARALAEARRVLKPDGTLRFWEHVRNDESRFWGTVQDVITPVWRWVGAGCHPNRRTERAIQDAGFRIDWLETVRMNPGTPAIYGVARKV